MTDIKHSKWECFCDEAYYSKWAVRNTNDKSFQASIHVGTQEEADFLVDNLNNLQQFKEALEAANGKAERYKRFLVEIKNEAQRGMKLREFELACEALEEQSK